MHLDQTWLRRFKLWRKMCHRLVTRYGEITLKKKAWQGLEAQFAGMDCCNMLLDHIDLQRETITALYLALGDTNACIEAVIQEQSKATAEALFNQRNINHRLLTGVSCKCS